MRLVGISGSLRRGSYNRMLLEAATRKLPRDVEVEFLQGLEDIPHYSEDADVEPAHPAIRGLRAALVAVDAFLVSTPEYNASLPGALKRASRADSCRERDARPSRARSWRWSAPARAFSASSGRRQSCAKCSRRSARE